MRLALFSLAVFAAAVPAGAATYAINNDTYLDNFYVSTTTGTVTTTIDNAHTNYGHGAAVKATSNNGSGSDYPGVNSITRALFTLPASFWTALGTGPAASPVTVTYYARNPSLATNDASKNPNAVLDPSNNIYYRQLRLSPLTQAFVAGTGGTATDTRSGGLNTATTKYGADWYTADGTVPWASGTTATPGGAFDDTAVASSVVSSATAVKSAITFDITSLINNAATRAESQANGLLMRVTDESSFTGNEFASLISYDSGAAAGTYSGFGPTVTFVPEPAALAAVGLFGTLMLRRRSA